MIAIAHAETPESLVLIHGIFEHTYYLDSTIIVHYIVDGNTHQDVYIGQIWHDVIPQVIPLFEHATEGIDILVVNANLIDLVVPADNDEDDPKII